MLKIQEKIEDLCLPESSSSVYSPQAELMRSYGGNSLAFPGLFPQNRHFLTPDRTGLVNYRVMNKVAVVLGDPVCAPEALERVVQTFLDFCAQRGWNVTFYQTSSEHLSIYQSLNMCAFKMGEEAMLNPQYFTLKFHPCWQSRYIVISSTLALPQIALAIFRLRNYSGSVAGLMHNSEKE